MRTTIFRAFLISNTAVPNTYSHSTFDPQSFLPLSEVPGPSDVQILYGSQTYNGIQQYVNSKVKFSRTSSLTMVSILDSLQDFSFQLIKRGSVAK